MSKEFVDAIVSGNNIEAETAFKNSISAKVGDALEIKRKEYSKSFVSNFEDVEIEDEELEEEETSEGAVKGAAVGTLLAPGIGTAIGAAIGHSRRKAGLDRYSKKALKQKKAGKKLGLKKATAANTRQAALKKAGIK